MKMKTRPTGFPPVYPFAIVTVLWKGLGQLLKTVQEPDSKNEQ